MNLKIKRFSFEAFFFRTICIALVLLVVPFLPASGIVKVGFVIAERLLYIPSMGFCTLIAIGYGRCTAYFYKWKWVLEKIGKFVSAFFH